MPIELPEYARPTTLSETVALLHQADDRAFPLQLAPRPPLFPPATNAVAVDLSALNLNYITRGADEQWHLGTQTPLQALVEHPELGQWATAARLAAHWGLRHAATLGGALWAEAGPPELKLVALACDALVQVPASPTPMAFADYQARSTELPIEVCFSSKPGVGALTRVARTPMDEAIVAVVVMLMGETLRVAVAGASSRPFCVAETTSAAALAQVLRACAPVADYRGSVEYRREMAQVLTQRALAEAEQHFAASI